VIAPSSATPTNGAVPIAPSVPIAKTAVGIEAAMTVLVGVSS
jgi:hypothetical protein